MPQHYAEALTAPVPKRLREPPSYFHKPPVHQQVSALPFDELPWPDFERLVLRVTEAEAGVQTCRIYGSPGQKQHGIDLLVILESGQVECVQCKKVLEFGPQDVRKAVEKFESGPWATKAISFTLCVTKALTSAQVTRAIQEASTRLAQRGVKFRVWDASASAGLNRKLKALPDIVEEFFGPGWVELFNGIDATSRTGAEKAGISEKLRLVLSDVLSCVASEGFGPLAQATRPDVDRQLCTVTAGPDLRTIIVHGEEGTGKSTAVRAWLREPRPHARWVLYASAAEVVEHARSIDELKTWLLASRLGIDPKSAARMQRRCAREPDLIVIDGLNERSEPAYWANLLASSSLPSASGTQLLVITRTEHLQRMRYAAMDSGELGQESALRVDEVVVPDFSEGQVRALLKGLGENVQHVPHYLRRPRLLQLAARHLGRLRTLSAVTYATLQLLELQSLSPSPDTFLDDLSDVVSREAARANLPAGIAPFMEQLALAQRSTNFRLDDWIEDSEERAWLVIGLWLRERLMTSDAHDIDGFVESIEQQLGSSQFDARATILEYATTASLLDDRTSRAMRLALIDRWLNCRNRVCSPFGPLGKLLVFAPDDVLDGIERALDDSVERDLVVDILIEALEGASRVGVSRRVSMWLGLTPVTVDRFGSGQSEDLSEEVQLAIMLGWPVKSAPRSSSNPRTVALHLLLARPELFDRNAITSAVASVAMNASHCDDELLMWALRRDDRNHGQVFEKLSSPTPRRTTTVRELDRLRHGAYPDAATEEKLGLQGRSSRIWYLELQRLALNPTWAPHANDARLQKFADDSGIGALQRGQTLQEHAFIECRAALALHRPVWLRAIATALVRQYVESEILDPPVLRLLADLAQVLSQSDLALLRQRARDLTVKVRSKDDHARNAVTSITQIVLHHLSPWRRLLILARFMPEGALTADLVDIVNPDADQVRWLAKQLLRRPDNARRIAFMLMRCQPLRTEAIEAVKGWLGRADVAAMSNHVLKNTLILAWRVGADDFIKKNASSSDPEHQRIADSLASMQVVTDPNSRMLDLILRASPDHWAVWCRRRAIGQLKSEAVANALSFVSGVDGSLTNVVKRLVDANETTQNVEEPSSAREAELSTRLLSLREASGWRFWFRGKGMKYWATVIPKHVQIWLDATDEQVVGSFEVFAGWAEAANETLHPQRRELIERRWRLECRAQRHANSGFLRKSVVDAFTLPARESGALWDEILETVRDDAELLRVVTAALKGDCASWLRTCIDADRKSTHGFRRARAEVIAGMAGLSSHPVERRVQLGGWLAASREFALEVERSHKWATTWYRRFRLTSQASVRVGAWLNLTTLADVRFLEVVHDEKLDYTECSRFYERAHMPTLRRAVERKQQEMAKSLLGVPLPSGNVGWLSTMRRSV